MGAASGDLAVESGAYLTNGEELFYVLRTFMPNGQVLLEDCMEPSKPAIACFVRDLARDGMTVVRPSAD